MKIGFTVWHLREISYEASMPVLGMFLDVYNLHGVLDASRCRMPRCRWRDRRSFWRILTGLIGRLWLNRWWKDRKPTQDDSSYTILGTRDSTRTVVDDWGRHRVTWVLIFLLCYFDCIIFERLCFYICNWLCRDFIMVKRNDFQNEYLFSYRVSAHSFS